MPRQSAIGAVLGAALALAAPAALAQGKPVEVTGEIIDTWCYFSGVMGGPDAVVGSAHHTCAMWCAAGGIPVGLLADDGTVYMVVKWQGDPQVVGAESLLKVQSHRLVASGMLHVSDGINYLFVEDVVEDEGLTNLSHQDYGVVPPFAIPEQK